MKNVAYILFLFSSTFYVKGQNEIDQYYINQSKDTTLSNQPNYTHGFYITNTNDTIGLGQLVTNDMIAIQTQVCLEDINGNKHTFKPTDIKSFAFYEYGKLCRYDAVNVDGVEFFLENRVDGTFLKKYAKRYKSYKNYDMFTPILCKNGYSISSYAKEDYNVTVSHALSDYPILSQIIFEKKCNLEFKRELKVIINEYNNWMYKRSKGLVEVKDTTMAVRGLLDANKYFKTKPVFLLTFLTNGLLTPFVGLPTALICGFTKPVFLRIPNKKLKENADYLAAYKARAYSRKNPVAAKGHLAGYLLLIPVIIVLAAIAH